MIQVLKYVAVSALLALTACNGGTDKIGGQSAVIGELRETVKKNREIKNRPASIPKITRAFLDTVTVPTLEVTVENTAQTAFLIPAAYRSDRHRGDVAVWKTVEQENIILREGVLIATRGLGRDLASSDVGVVVKSTLARKNGKGARVMQVRNDVNGDDEFRLQCDVSVRGQKTILIVNKPYLTTHMIENCVFNDAVISNEYWIDSGGEIRQSRQWAGPALGYLRMRLLKRSP